MQTQLNVPNAKPIPIEVIVHHPPITMVIGIALGISALNTLGILVLLYVALFR